MKKRLIISLFLLLIFPLVVLADETEFSVSIWDVEDYENAKTVCLEAADNANNSITNTDGKNKTYAQCVEISCENSKIVHKTIDSFSDMVSCENGNTNPYALVSKTGATDDELKEGATCSGTDPIAYATEAVVYNCSKTTSSSSSEPVDYVVPEDPTEPAKPSNDPTEPSNNDTPEADNNNSSSNKDDEATITDTGVSDYYIALGCIAAVLCIGLYALNKKNVFKKI